MLILFRCFATQKKSLKNIYQYKATSCEANHAIRRTLTMTTISVHFLPAISTEVTSVQYENQVKDHTGAIFSIHSQILLTNFEGGVLAFVMRTCLSNRPSCTFMIFDRVWTNGVLKIMTNLHENEQYSDRPCSLAISTSEIFNILGENLHLLNSSTITGLRKLTRSLIFLIATSTYYSTV